jgi:platelet-activating factor acetylhydrolase IB subunit alpha
MVLTDRQRSDLHAGIYEYLRSQDGKYFAEAADALKEADPGCSRDTDTDTETPSTPGTGEGTGADDASVTTTSTKFSRMTFASSTRRMSQLPILERKWTAVPRLQRKVLDLEKALASNANAKAHVQGKGPGGKTSVVGFVNVGSDVVERRMLPRQPQMHAMAGHAGTITCLAIHPTFTVAVSGSEDGTIKVWDHESGEYTKTLKGHTNTVRSVAFTPTGTHLASASSDLSIKLWDISTYACVRTLRGHDHTISAVRFIPSPLTGVDDMEKKSGNGTATATATATGIDSIVAGTSFLISASRDKTIKFWDVETGFVEHTISDSNDWVRCLAVRDSDGMVMASAGNEQTISIYETTGDRNKIATLVGHEHIIETLSFVTAPTPAEKKDKGAPSKEINEYLASGGRDRSVRLWNITTEQCLNVFKYHENWVRSVILHPSGKYIISAGDDRTVRVMDIKSNRCLRTLEDAHPHFVTCLAMHHTLPIMVSGGVDQIVNCWQLE